MLNHLQHCLKWRRHDCDMLSIYSNKPYMVSCMRAIHNLITPFLQPMSVTTRPHTQYLTSSEAVTFTIIRSKTDQTAHGHTITLHATGGSYAQSELSLECLHLINHFSHRNKVHHSHCSCWFQRTLHKLLDHMTRHNTIPTAYEWVQLLQQQRLMAA